MRLLRRALAVESNPMQLAKDDMFHLNFGHVDTKPPVYDFDGDDFTVPLELGLEEIADGKPFKEIEHTIYAKLTDFTQLNKAASKERHEQWELKIPKTDKNAGKGSVRIRKTVIEGGDPSYVLTTKVSMNDKGDKIELPIPTNEDNFQQFRFLAERGLIKDRFHFPIVGTELVWEIDMFLKEDGSYHEWCKIDLEVKNREDQIPELPINFEEVIMPPGFGDQDEAKNADLVQRLYDEIFVSKNPFLNKSSETPEQ